VIDKRQYRDSSRGMLLVISRDGVVGLTGVSFDYSVEYALASVGCDIFFGEEKRPGLIVVAGACTSRKEEHH
jgi:hypothetical protein